MFRSFMVEGLHRLLPSWNGEPHNLEFLHASKLPEELSDSQKAELFDLVNEAVHVHGGRVFRLGYYNDSVHQTILDHRVARNTLPLAFAISNLQQILLRFSSGPFVSVYELNISSLKHLDLYYNDTDLHLDKMQVSGATNSAKWLANYNGDSLGTFYATKRNIHLWAVDFIAWQLNIRHRNSPTSFQKGCMLKFDRVDACVELDAIFWLNDFKRSKIVKDKSLNVGRMK